MTVSNDAVDPVMTAPPGLVIDDVRLPGAAEPVQLVVRDGIVVHLGPAATPLGPVERVEAAGRTLVPGLWDAHVHAAQWAAARRRVDLTSATSARHAAALVHAAAGDPEQRHARDLLVGQGFRDGLWNDRPHKAMLDAAAPDRPVVLQSADLHTAWLSSAALRLLGAGDHPDGVLVETDAYRAMASLPDAERTQIDRWVAEAMTAAAARGVTGITDFEIGDCLPDWQRRTAEQAPDVRIACTVYREHFPTAVTRGLRTGEIVPGTFGQVEVGPVKLFVDGSLNSRTAWCHDPYPLYEAGGGGNGRLETPPEEVTAVMAAAADQGLQCAIHAIGDRATTIALDSFHALGVPGRIEHAQLIAPEDIPRFAMPGLVVGVQPAHAPDDRDVADRHWAGRTANAFPYAALLRAGATLEIGSDAPVAPLDPWDGIASAVTRTDDERPAWHPEQRIDVRSALTAAARGRAGVSVGDPADLVLLDHDPTAVGHELLRDPGVAGTLLAGRWTHRAL